MRLRLLLQRLRFPLQLAPAAGQGATGGSIGKQDKSISGAVDEDRPRSRSTERSKPKSERSSSRGNGSSHDGRYTMNAVGGAGCTGQSGGSSTLVISGGRAGDSGDSTRRQWQRIAARKLQPRQRRWHPVGAHLGRHRFWHH